MNAAHFLNVDLDLASRRDLDPLVTAFGTKIFALHSNKERGLHRVSLELTEQRYVKAADSCIARFASLVEKLPAPARRLWDSAKERRFDIGIQAATTGGAFQSIVKEATLRRVSAIHGELVVTVYGATPTTKRPRKKR